MFYLHIVLLHMSDVCVSCECLLCNKNVIIVLWYVINIDII